MKVDSHWAYCGRHARNESNNQLPSAAPFVCRLPSSLLHPSSLFSLSILAMQLLPSPKIIYTKPGDIPFIYCYRLLLQSHDKNICSPPIDLNNLAPEKNKMLIINVLFPI